MASGLYTLLKSIPSPAAAGTVFGSSDLEDVLLTIPPVKEAELRRQGSSARLDRVRKSFGETEVLHGIDLAVAPGEFVAIVGRSGCGKSTVLRLLAGLEAPTSGTVTLNDQAASGLAADTRMMFQDARLLPWRRVLSNVALARSGADSTLAAKEALEAVGLGTRGGDWPSVLSGGQRQRVALARALVAQPRLLLLDEPLGALDALTRLEMQALIEHVWLEQGFTAVLVTHDVGEAVALADRVVLIEDGRITFERTIDLPRPRRRGTAEFAELEGEILTRILGTADPAWF